MAHTIIDEYSLLDDPALKVIDPVFKTKIMGRKKEFCAQMMVDHFKLDMTYQDYIDVSYRHEFELFAHCQTMRGAESIVNALHERQIPIAMATGSSGPAFQMKKSKHEGLFSKFHSIVVGDDAAVKAGKPAPDIFIEAARRIGGDGEPFSCLVVEDSPNGVMAGLAAGMHVAWIPDPELQLKDKYPDLFSHQMVTLFDDLHQLHHALLPLQ